VRQAFVGPLLEIWPQQHQILWTKGTGNDPNDIGHFVFDLQPLEQGTEIFCLRITDSYGLALEKCAEPEQTYCRVGIFHLRYQSGRKPLTVALFPPAGERVVTII
jgi:hypothetical protein